MKIQSVNSLNHIQIQQNVKNNQNIAFKNYRETLYKAVRSNVNDTEAAEKLFDTLFKDACEEPYTHRNPVFKTIDEIYKQSGFRGLLKELRRPQQNQDIQKVLDDNEQNFIQIITQHGQPLFELFHFGKFSGPDGVANDIKVIFRNQTQKENLEFNLGKKLNLNVARNNGQTCVDTEYYTTTGTPKIIVENSGGNQTKTYYNEDGTEPFFKNLFFGGTTISTF